jgi:hypothetical protein
VVRNQENVNELENLYKTVTNCEEKDL